MSVLTILNSVVPGLTLRVGRFFKGSIPGLGLTYLLSRKVSDVAWLGWGHGPM